MPIAPSMANNSMLEALPYGPMPQVQRSLSGTIHG